MRCPACDASLPSEARYCPACGCGILPEAVVEPATVESAEPGAWAWFLLLLLLVERGAAWLALPPFSETRAVGTWEASFWWAWGLGLLVPALPLLAFRRRPGGWLAFLSGGALAIRSCIPMLAEKPADGAVWTLMVASATLTFAFLYEQSYWGREAGTSPS
jgi:hypothetical protein